jgi:hypothetical protein
MRAAAVVTLMLMAIVARALEPSPSAESTTIEWDAATLRLIELRGSYGRMVRLKDGAVACVFDRAGKMWIRHSTDDGKTFAEPILVASNPDSWLTNADLLVLKSGQLLYFWNDRPLAAMKYAHRPAPEGLLKTPFRICMSRSEDNGRSWSRPQTLYSAGAEFQNGCWEPAAVERASGEIQVYFANESPYRDSAEQEISRLQSRDGGRTWDDAQRISFRAGHRDGMPSPLVLAGDGSVVVAIEDNGIDGDAFKPAIVHIPLAADAKPGAVLGDSADRWPALAEPLSPKTYAGAPGLRQLPSGLTLLCYQESADGALEHCRMAVCVGTSDARRFGNKTYPLGQDATPGQMWNSLFVKDALHITAISGASVKGKNGIWAIDGRVVQVNAVRIKSE